MKNLLVCLLLIIIGVILFSLTLRGIWGNPPASSIKGNLDQSTKPFELSPERGRFLLTQNLSEHNSFALSKDQADAASPDVGYYKGNYYIYFAPGISIFALPFYNLGLQYNLSQVFTFGMVGLFAIFNLIFIFLIARDILKLRYWAAIFASITFGFASVALSYATTLYQHQSAVFFIISSFYAAWKYRRHQRWGFLYGFFIWINYGLAILVDYPNAILMLPVMVYFLASAIKIQKLEDKFKLSFRLSILFTSIFFIVIMVLHGYYNQVNFGSWKTVSGSLIGLKTIQEQKLDQGDVDQNIKAFMAKKNPVGFFKEQFTVNGLYELSVAQDKGIFVFSPIFIFGFLGILLLLKKREVNIEVGTLIALVLTNIFFYISWGDPWGGWAFGPRYLIPGMAILALFVGVWLDKLPKLKLINRLIALILFGFSAAVSLLGALTTNGVPPKTEADYLHTKYGFMFNLDFLYNGNSSSFLYNNYFQNLSLVNYYFYILSALVVLAYILLFIFPLFEKRKEIK